LFTPKLDLTALFVMNIHAFRLLSILLRRHFVLDRRRDAVEAQHDLGREAFPARKSAAPEALKFANSTKALLLCRD
jgi:hypothetical protein